MYPAGGKPNKMILSKTRKAAEVSSAAFFTDKKEIQTA
jgi:hypothetical protein